MKLKRILKWVGVSIACLWGLAIFLIMLFGAAIQVLPYFLKPKVEAEIAAIKAKDEPVTQSELAKPPIPDAENGAVVYQKIFQAIDDHQTWDDLVLALSLLSTQERRENPELWNEAALAIGRLDHLIPMVEEAQSRRKCVFPVNWNEPPPSVKYPQFAYLRRLSGLLCASAMLSAREGNPDKALQSLTMSYGMISSIPDSPNLMFQLTRFEMALRPSSALRLIARQSHINELQAKRLYDQLSGIDMSDDAYDAMVGERAMGISCFEVMRENPYKAISQFSPPSQKPAIRRGPPSAAWQAMIYWDELFYLRTMRKWIAQSRLPYRKIRARHLDSEPEIPRYCLMSAILLPVFPRSAPKQDTATAYIAGDQILLALIAYKDRHGSYPVGLAELRSKLGWKSWRHRYPRRPRSDSLLLCKRAWLYRQKPHRSLTSKSPPHHSLRRC